MLNKVKQQQRTQFFFPSCIKELGVTKNQLLFFPFSFFYPILFLNTPSFLSLTHPFSP